MTFINNKLDILTGSILCIWFICYHSYWCFLSFQFLLQLLCRNYRFRNLAKDSVINSSYLKFFLWFFWELMWRMAEFFWTIIFIHHLIAMAGIHDQWWLQNRRHASFSFWSVFNNLSLYLYCLFAFVWFWKFLVLVTNRYEVLPSPVDIIVVSYLFSVMYLIIHIFEVLTLLCTEINNNTSSKILYILSVLTCQC